MFVCFCDVKYIYCFVLRADDLRHPDFNLSGLKSGNWYRNIAVDSAPGDLARRLVS